jgi:hypothetical protein
MFHGKELTIVVLTRKAGKEFALRGQKCVIILIQLMGAMRLCVAEPMSVLFVNKETTTVSLGYVVFQVHANTKLRPRPILLISPPPKRTMLEIL